MNESNLRRIHAWQSRMRADGYYYDLLAHMRQLASGVDWGSRLKSGRIRNGRLRMGPDGFLPRNKL